MYGFLYCIAFLVVKAFFFARSEGVENIPESGPVILCPNHKSMWDPIVVTVMQKRKMTFMAKEEIFKNPLLRWFFKKLNAYPIKREQGDAAGVKAFVQMLKEGNQLLIFPEGTRIRNGKVSRPKNGAVRIAGMADAKIVPVGIKGNFKIFRPVTVFFGEPVNLKNTDTQNVESLKAVTEDIMDKAYKMTGEKRICK